MKRTLVLGILLAFGFFTISVAHQPPGPTPVSIKAARIEKVRDNLYVITGSSATEQEAFSGGVSG
jgi:hypothetical protein